MTKRMGDHRDDSRADANASWRKPRTGADRSVAQPTSEAAPRDPTPRRPGKASVAGAGAEAEAEAETLARGAQRRKARPATQAERAADHDAVARMVDAEVPRAPPERMLPPAERATEVEDFLRELREELDSAIRAAGQLWTALGGLAAAPVRLWHLLCGRRLGA
jgi:hypothetical protein